MIVQRLGSRGFLCTFDDDISLYIIACTGFHLLCDTHLGPDSIRQIQECMSDRLCQDRVVVFNSHSDWDHIWGNCAFPDSMIIGHESCRTRMIERGEYDLMQNRSKMRGMVRIHPPNITFSDRLVMEDEKIDFFHAPGHTIDSAVCYDNKDGVLYLGDLVENPIPYLDAMDLDVYLTTLRSIITHQAKILISAHSGVVTRDLIRKNLSYITNVRNCVPVDSAEFGEYKMVHQWNLNQRIVLKYEALIRERDGGLFSFAAFLEHVGDLHEISQKELEKNLSEYLLSG